MIYFGKVDIMSKCIGCGAILQDKSPLDEGYTNDLTHKYCIRCFNIKNYNKYLKVSNKDYTDLIKKIDSKNDLILYVTDFLNFNLPKFKSPTILVVTKADIIPRNINKEYFLDKFKGNFIDKVIISSKNNYNFDLIYSKILKYKKTNNVYVIGYTNAGKSTFINKMIKNYGNGEGYITTSNLPSTTLNLIEAKVNDKLTLIDSPGLLDYGNIILNSGKSDLNKIIPKKEIRPISFQIKDKQYLYIENFLRIDLENTNIIIYMSNNLEYKRLYKNKECTLKKYDLKIKSNQDLVIKGLGFITFKKTSNFTLWLKEDVEYLIRDSII